MVSPVDVRILSNYTVLEPDKKVEGVLHLTTEIMEEGDRTISAGGMLPFLTVAHTPHNRTMNNQIIAIDTSGAQKKLTLVDTRDVTRWNVFKSWFGIGKLAHKELSIKDVTTYLSTYDWKAIAQNKDRASDEYKAFTTVCKLAGLVYIHHKAGSNSQRLWNKVSELVKTTHGNFLVNPGCTYRHIRYQAILQNKSWADLSKQDGGTRPAPTEPMRNQAEIEAYPQEILRENWP